MSVIEEDEFHERLMEGQLIDMELKKILSPKYEWFEKAFNEANHNRKIVVVRTKEGASIFADRYEIDKENGITLTVTLFRKKSIIALVPIQSIEEVK